MLERAMEPKEAAPQIELVRQALRISRARRAARVVCAAVLAVTVSSVQAAPVPKAVPAAKSAPKPRPASNARKAAANPIYSVVGFRSAADLEVSGPGRLPCAAAGDLAVETYFWARDGKILSEAMAATRRHASAGSGSVLAESVVLDIWEHHATLTPEKARARGELACFKADGKSPS